MIAPRGTRDIFDREVAIWQYVEKKLHNISQAYCYSEIRTPIFEYTEVFARSNGETSDIVQKEMYTFNDKKGRSLSLRPEQTAAAIRFYLEQKLYADNSPNRIYYIGPYFRYEKPQVGRYRQFHQFGVECVGGENTASDVEVISLAHSILKTLGLTDATLKINTLGNAESREQYTKALKDYLSNKQDLCHDCNTRIEQNPLRVLDCKICQDNLQDVPHILDYLDEDAKNRFAQTRQMLDILGIEYVIDQNLVRGLDYYTAIVFEFQVDGLAILGGGRYDNLVEEFGGQQTKAVGFGMGIDRLVNTLISKNLYTRETPKPLLFIATVGDEAYLQAQKIAYTLRQNNISTVCDVKLGQDGGISTVKNQMKQADKLGCKFSMLLGEDELKSGTARIKNMQTGEWKEAQLNSLETLTGVLSLRIF